MDALTLDQFLVFVTVAREGSFAAAARRMNRAQSAITYTIQRLEEQSGVVLFDRSAYRPVLTEAGNALLPRAKQILDEVDDYRRHVREILNGLEATLAVVIDLHAPCDLLARTLAAFSHAFPRVKIAIRREPIEAAVNTLRAGDADIGLLVEWRRLSDEFVRYVFGSVPLVAVAAPTHPLGRIGGRCSAQLLRSHTQLVYGSGFGATGGHDYVAQCVNCWSVSDLESKLELILAGVGWGRLPRPKIAHDLAAGRLVELHSELEEGSAQLPEFPLVLAHLKERSFGPSTLWLIQQFKAEA